MHSLRKWFYRPKKEDSSKLALFYWADEELTMVAAELDSFDGRTDPDRCSILVSQLRICQDKVLSICNDIMDDAIADMRANRDFRAKFPDDVLHENLAGQLWFGAECLAAGSNIIHRELESASMRPLAKALTRALDNVRCLLREQSLKNAATYSEKVREALRIFDRLFAEFELCYVGAMVPIKSAKEYHLQQEIVVLFSETLIRALKLSLVTQDMIDDYDPSLMFTIPRLAIVWGLLLYPDGPFNVERESADLSELFRPFCNLLFKIRDLLWTLTEPELHTLEKMLCSQDEPKIDKTTVTEIVSSHAAEDYVGKFYQKQINCKQFIHDFYAYNFGTPGPESVPERSDGSRKEECRSNNDSKRSHSSAFELGMEFGSRPSGDLQGSYHKVASEVEGDEIKALRSCDVVGVVSDSCEEMNHSGMNENNKEVSKEGIGENPLMDNSLDSSRCRSSPKLAGSPYRHSTSSLEDRLSRLHHSKCTCPAPRDRLTPSRELMRQVMRQVEIVPLGQRVTGYGSSPDNSPRAFHHGILSHSFPANGNIGDVVSLSKEVVEGRPRRRGPRKSRRRPPVQDCDIVPATRGFYTSNSNEVGSHWDPNPPLYTNPLAIPRLPRVEDLATNSEYSSCSSCQSVSSVSSAEWDSTSPDTSSYNSECQDDEEIALALQAAEIASRNKARSRFKSSGDLLHKLFVCISGVADQLQTNYASDLRNILKSVFDMNCTQNPEEEVDTICDNLNNNPPAETPGVDPNNFNNNFDIPDGPLFNRNLRGEEEEDEDDDEDDRDHSSVDSAEEAIPDGSLVISELEPNNGNGRDEHSFSSTGPPEWIPDELSSQCMACKLQFTILRRRHHCRNCGKIFCSRCSSNTIPLPRYGHLKPVRVCNQCFMYQLTNLVMQRQL